MTEFQAAKEENKIRQAYRKRDEQGKKRLYQWYRGEVLFNQYRLDSVFASLCRSAGIEDLSGLEMLDVGCGAGGWLRRLVEWEATPEKLHGIDLLEDRIEAARKRSPMIDFQVSSGYSIPLGDASMDLVFAHTVFSSILDPGARAALAKEMRRVLKPGGHIMIYDFRISNPKNPDTVGIRKSEVMRLFPGFNLNIRSLTLAPPLARRIAPISISAAHLFETLFPFLRSHAVFFLKHA